MSVSLESPSNSLTKQEMRVVNIHTGHSTLNGIRRGVTFLKELEGKNKAKMAVYVTFKSAVIIAKYTAIGAGAGGVVGGAIGTVIEPGAGTLAGGVLGLQTGAGIGAAVGSIVAIKKVKVEIEQSPRYLNWQRRAIEERVFPIFDKILNSDDFIDFKCPLSLFLTRIPLVTPCGHTFEKLDIENWLVTSAHKDCPVCREPFTAKELVYDDKRVINIIRAARAQIALLKTSQDKNAPQLEEGFSALIEDNINHASQIHEAQAKVEAKKALSLKTGEDEYIEAMRKVYRTRRAELGISSETVTK